MPAEHQKAPQFQSAPSRGGSLAGVRSIIAVASGKGGVGKSTVSVNLAVALADAGHSVGLVDADIHGPSIPGMLGLQGVNKPEITVDQKIAPLKVAGLKVISMGMLTGDDAPAIMRGPMVTKYLQMFVAEVAWGELDFLILDLPPGTGDTQLTLAQSFPLTGAIIVTTPQDVSLKIARRGARMFEQVKVPLIGVIENMSGFACPSCGTVTDIFRRGGGAKLAEALGAPYLGAVPLDGAIVDCGDDGDPIARSQPDSAPARAYGAIAAGLASAVSEGAKLPLPFAWSWEVGAGTAAPDLTPDPDAPPARPLDIRREDARTLSILWADGMRQRFDARDLRLACPCAACIDEMSGKALLDPATVPLDITPVKLGSVGNYALSIAFSDGHDTGIYSYERLRAMAQHEVEDV